MDLILYDSMCRAIGEAYQVDEVKEIRDKALAMEAYFKQAKDPEPERRCCEIRLRAERRSGQLLANMEKAGRGADKKGQGSQRGTSEAPTLDEMDVSKNQSSQWQQLASVPEEEFEAALSDEEKPSTSGIINGAKPKKDPMDPHALWLWGRLRDFERDGLIDRGQEDLLSKMTDGMKADTIRLSRIVGDWLKGGFGD